MNTGTGQGHHRRRGIVIACALAVALVGIGVIAGVNHQGTPSTTAPVSTATSTPTPSPAAPESEWLVEAGGGGNGEFSADGVTPVGYEPTCEGAIAAATNYYVGVNEGLYQDRLTADQFDAFLDEINAGLTADATWLTQLKADFRTTKAQVAAGATHLDLEFYPEWGGFRVPTHCNAHIDATVDVLSFAESEQAPGYAVYNTARIQVAWFDDDWRLVDLAPLDYAPTHTLPVDLAAPVPAETRRSLLQAEPGWMEYTNAP